MSLSGCTSSLHLVEDLVEDVASVVVTSESIGFEVGIGSILLLGASRDSLSGVKDVGDRPIRRVIDDSLCGLSSIAPRGCSETVT